MVEVMVASILFLIVFFLSVETVTRISAHPPDDTLLAVEMDMNACVHEFSTGTWSIGEYKRIFTWGEIDVSIERYRALPDVLEMKMECKIDRRRSFVFRKLIPGDEA